MDHKIHEPADRQVRAIAPDGIDTAFDTAGAVGLLAAVELAKNTNRVCTFYAYDLIEKLDLRTFAESVRQPALLSWWIFIQRVSFKFR